MDPIRAFLLSYSDSSFTNPHRVALPDPPVFDPDAYTFVGKEMDGLESKRHCAIEVLEDEPAFIFDPGRCNWFRLGLEQRAEISRIDVNTQWFTGNQVQNVSIVLIDTLKNETRRVLGATPLQPGRLHNFAIPPTPATECLVECFYDGGIARVQLYGKSIEPVPQERNLLEHATVSHVSNEHYGHPVQAVVGDRSVGHMVGWESARTGFGEHALFTLAQPAIIRELVVDTYMHVNNAPLTAHAFGIRGSDEEAFAAMTHAPQWALIFEDGHRAQPKDIVNYMKSRLYLQEPTGERPFRVNLEVESGPWKPLLPFARVRRDTYNRFIAQDVGPISHLLFMFFPNGGLHGLRVHGS